VPIDFDVNLFCEKICKRAASGKNRRRKVRDFDQKTAILCKKCRFLMRFVLCVVTENFLALCGNELILNMLTPLVRPGHASKTGVLRGGEGVVGTF